MNKMPNELFALGTHETGIAQVDKIVSALVKHYHVNWWGCPQECCIYSDHGSLKTVKSNVFPPNQPDKRQFLFMVAAYENNHQPDGQKIVIDLLEDTPGIGEHMIACLTLLSPIDRTQPWTYDLMFGGHRLPRGWTLSTKGIVIGAEEPE
jgi:hypothetical protein